MTERCIPVPAGQIERWRDLLVKGIRLHDQQIRASSRAALVLVLADLDELLAPELPEDIIQAVEEFHRENPPPA